MRMIVVFEKGWRLRHIGHLDLLRTMHRALRRTELPIAYSQGFNPHILSTFASALSVGVAGEREIMDVALTQEVSEDWFKQELSRALPPDLPVKEVYAVTDQHPAPMAQLAAAGYRVHMTGEDAAKLADAIPQLLARTEIPAMRKSKSGLKPCDIRPMIYHLSAEKTADGVTFQMQLALREQSTCKPDLLLNALAEQAGLAELPPRQIIRTVLYGMNDSGDLIPLENM